MKREHCCSAKKISEENKQKRRNKLKWYDTVKNQQDSDDYTLPTTDYEVLIKKGQPKTKPLILDQTENSNIVAVIQDDQQDHWNAGLVGTRTTIQKGECSRCGCNRVKVSHNAQAGVIAECVACQATTETHREAIEWSK